MHWTLKVGIAAFVIATPVKWFANGFEDKTEYESPSRSSLEARLRGTYLCPAHFTSSTIQHKDHQIVIREAWVEKQSKHGHFLVWLPYRKIMDSYMLCFTLKKGKHLFDAPSALFWVNDDAGHGFGVTSYSKGGALYFAEELETLPASLKVSLLESWKQPRPKDIEIMIDR